MNLEAENTRLREGRITEKLDLLERRINLLATERDIYKTTLEAIASMEGADLRSDGVCGRAAERALRVAKNLT